MQRMTWAWMLGFVLAWTVGLVVAMDGAQPAPVTAGDEAPGVAARSLAPA